jgi:hypothetical protein
MNWLNEIFDFFQFECVAFISLDLPFSEDIAVNKLIGTTLAAIATFENDRASRDQSCQRIGEVSRSQNCDYKTTN